ncbi:MAG: class I SAM-dependent methyltransferase [Clostridia bacterium]|nr:class I SAM-dependent methyltransferase [Clostridia bacterium]
MLNMTVRQTNKLIRATVKSDNLRLGRFFTKKETARLLAGLLELPDKPAVRVLDAGAGTGILSAAVIERLCESGTVREIRLLCCENDARCLPVLKDNLERLRRLCRRRYKVRLAATVLEENFVLAGRSAYTLSLYKDEPELFDLVLTHPPTALLAPASPEALCVPDLFSGEVDLCYLFLAMAECALAPGGQLAAILPTAFATSPSLTRMRRFFFSQNTPRRIHVFETGKAAKPLKKTFVLTMTHRAPAPDDTVVFSASRDAGTPEKTVILDPLPLSQVMTEPRRSLLLMHDPAEVQVLAYMRRLPCSFAYYGLRMKTGLTLPSRYRACLFDEPARGLIPLICPAAVSEGRVAFPVIEKSSRIPLPGQYVSPVIPSLMQRNRNMLFIKRVPARSDGRRLVCAVYLASQLPGYTMISTHNKLNYIDTSSKGEMDPAFLWGLYAFLTSAPYDLYVRILSKSGQINAGEFSDLPLPTADVLRKMGSRLMAVKLYSPDYCDKVVAEVMRISVKM